MPKDLKIGVFLGMLLVTIAAFWLCIGRGLPQIQNSKSREDTFSQEQAPTVSNNLPTNSSAIKDRENERPLTTDVQSAHSDLTNKKAEKLKTKKFHIIRERETLSDISRIYYGSANEWRKIYNANREIIKDVNQLRPGTKIIIPE